MLDVKGPEHTLATPKTPSQADSNLEGMPTVATDDVATTLMSFYQSDYPTLVGYATFLVGDRNDAHEIVQEAFTRTLAGWPQVRDKANPAGYVRKVIVNLVRSRRRRVIPFLGRTAESPSSESIVIAGETSRRLHAALQRLPTRQRECVLLRFYAGWSTQEAADAMGVSTGTVKNSLHKALRSLREQVDFDE